MTTVVTTKNAVRELVPVVRERLADLETPVSAFAKLRPLGGAFLLESVEGGEHVGRYSFLGKDPFLVLRSRDDDPWVPLSFGQLSDGTPCICQGGRVTPRTG